MSCIYFSAKLNQMNECENVFNPHLSNHTANEQKDDEFGVFHEKSLKILVVTDDHWGFISTITS